MQRLDIPIFDYADKTIFNQLLESRHQTDYNHFWPCSLQIFSITFLIFLNLCQHAKNQLIPHVHSEDTVNFRIQRPDWPHSFLTMTNQIFLTNFYAVSLICSGEMVYLKFWNLIGWEDFGLHLWKKIILKCMICAGTQQIRIFIIEQIQWKLLTKFFF